MNTVEMLALVNREFNESWVSAEQLVGGFVNQVWRLRGPSGTVVVKHAPPYVATLPDVPLSRRLRIEALCLHHFGGHPGVVAVPKMLGYLRSVAVLVMEDCVGSHSLEEVLRDQEVDGARLGEWMRRLHERTASVPQFAELLRNQEIQETRFEVQYGQVSRWLAEVGCVDADALGDVAERLGNQLLRKGQCLIMGDLWPRSILVASDKLWIIDWEFAHFGDRIQDLGHLAAHCWMFAHCAATTSERQRWARFWFGFQRGYGAIIGGANRDAGIHAGAEVLTRTVGAFRDSIGYSGFDSSSYKVQEAIEAASFCLRSGSLDDFSEGGRLWRS
jgi:aminoglycoside phosphotransferase (APT) family kinase protein